MATKTATHTARLEKHTFFHVTVQDFHEAQEHFLVPKDSEQMNREIKVFPAPSARPAKRPVDRVSTLVVGPTGNSSRYHPWGVDAEEERQERPFDCQMIPVGYSECVSVVGNLPPRQNQSCVSYCDVQSPKRYRTTLQVAPSLDPVGYTTRVVCFRDCTKKRFKNEVKYQPKLKTTNYTETNIVRPKTVVTSFVTFFDYNAYETEQLHTTTMELAPRSCSLTSIHNFELLDRRRGSVSSEEDIDDKWTVRSLGGVSGYNTMSSEEDIFSARDDAESGYGRTKRQVVEVTPMGRLPRRWSPETELVDEEEPMHRTRGVVNTPYRDPTAYREDTIIFADHC